MKIGVVGATGYVGAELLRLCSQHPEMDVELMAASSARELSPALQGAFPGRGVEAFDPAMTDGLDLVFLALPHGESQRLMADLLTRVGAVIDLAADFRLRDPADYERWYGASHAAPDLLADAVYGLPELHTGQFMGKKLIAAPGCYPTASALALAPLVAAGAIEADGIIVDAASGVSGAGRGSAHSFCETDGGFAAYGLSNHRHTPEIEQAVGGSVLFTPHLAPMSRGILATCYGRTVVGGGDAAEVLKEAYKGRPFVTVTETPPSTKATVGSNNALLHATVDDRTGWTIVLCAIDNLVKGAAGQAIQCANLLAGLDETCGLPLAGVSP